MWGGWKGGGGGILPADGYAKQMAHQIEEVSANGGEWLRGLRGRDSCRP